MAITIGELAKRTGVTVRTLHHYDELGLVVPSARSPAGYRLYADEDVLRLQQVLVLRELELPLPDIARVLAGDEPRDELLARHRALLVARRGRLDAVIASIDRAIGRKDEPMTPDEMKQLFDGFDPAAYEDEVKARWGDTDAYQESARRAARYGKAEWTQIQQEAEAINTALVAQLRAGVPSTHRRSRRWWRSTARTSSAGSIRARSRCTSSSPRCTSRMLGSSTTSTSSPTATPTT